MKKVVPSKCGIILQILLQILTWEGETYRLIYSLSTFGGVRTLKIRFQMSLATGPRQRVLTVTSVITDEGISMAAVGRQ